MQAIRGTFENIEEPRACEMIRKKRKRPLIIINCCATDRQVSPLSLWPVCTASTCIVVCTYSLGWQIFHIMGGMAHVSWAHAPHLEWRSAPNTHHEGASPACSVPLLWVPRPVCLVLPGAPTKRCGHESFFSAGILLCLNFFAKKKKANNHHRLLVYPT